jgi:hypothetical protein
VAKGHKSASTGASRICENGRDTYTTILRLIVTFFQLILLVAVFVSVIFRDIDLLLKFDRRILRVKACQPSNYSKITNSYEQVRHIPVEKPVCCRESRRSAYPHRYWLQARSYFEEQKHATSTF